MAGGGVDAERELKSILMGDEEVIERETKSVPEEREEYYFSLVDDPFISLRGAGSLGIDIVAMRKFLTLPIEIKTTKKKYDTVYFSEDDEQQYQWMFERANEVETALFYAYRRSGFRGERWRMYRVESTMSALNFDFLPTLSETPTKHKIEWEDGMPLSYFLEKIEGYGKVKIKYDDFLVIDTKDEDRTPED